MILSDEIAAIVERALAAAQRREAEVVVLAGWRQAAELNADGSIGFKTDSTLRARLRVVRGTSLRASMALEPAGHTADDFVSAFQQIDEEIDQHEVSEAIAEILHPGTMSSTSTQEPDRRTANSGPVYAADAAIRALLAARDCGIAASGSYSIELGGLDDDENVVRIVNSWGLDRSFSGARARASFRFFRDDGVVDSFDLVSPRRAEVGTDADFIATAERVASAEGVIDAPLRTATPVVFERAAVAALLSRYLELLSEQAIIDGRSPFRLGSTELVCAEQLGVAFNPADPRNPMRPFDGEGVPSRRVDIVVNGRIGELPQSRRAAARIGAPWQGYSPLQPSVRPFRLRGAIVESNDPVPLALPDDALVIAEFRGVHIIDVRQGIAHAVVERSWQRTRGLESMISTQFAVRLDLCALFRGVSAVGEARATPAGILPAILVDDPAFLGWL